jgi:23S rRNA (pseudouridine1915-N3)-methyltransferase
MTFKRPPHSIEYLSLFIKISQINEMEIIILATGKTNESCLNSGINDYLKRLKHYLNIKFIYTPELKEKGKLSIAEIKENEAQALLKMIPQSSYIVLLDENGGELSSVDFSSFIQKQLNSGIKKLVFLIGGPYGVAEEMKNKANYILSLSKMTFTHQFIRLIFVEQLYRAMTILKKEPYHNE